LKLRHVTDLRAAVQTHSRHAQIFALRCAATEFAGAADGHAKFVFAQPGRDVRMRFGRHIRIYAQGNVGNFAEFRGAPSQQLELAFTFHIEQKNAAAERQTQLVGGLADSGEHNFNERLLVCAADTLQFAAGDNVKPSAHAGQQTKDAQV